MAQYSTSVDIQVVAEATRKTKIAALPKERDAQYNYRGQRQNFPVKRVDISLLVYRMANGRTILEQEAARQACLRR